MELQFSCSVVNATLLLLVIFHSGGISVQNADAEWSVRKMTKGEAVNWIINLSAAIGKTQHQDLWHYEQALSEIKDMLEAEPEQKTGKWQKYEGRFDYNWECSECGCSAWEKTDYCAHCGARMVGEEDGSD
jgi:excinuclease UvrABC ATPase subunit